VLTEALKSDVRDVVIYFSDGLANGYDDIDRITFQPRLYGVSPATGSAGGTLITVTGSGFGVDDDPESWPLQGREGNGWEEICDEVKIVAFGKLTCLTKAIELRPRSLRLKNKPRCENAQNENACDFEQTFETSPIISSVSMQGTESFIFTGERFPTQGYTAYGMFKKSQAAGIINSGQSATVVFPYGIPVAEVAEKPKLVFVNADDGSELTAHWNDTVQALENSLSVQESTSGL
jgi:hypothetical protein